MKIYRALLVGAVAGISAFVASSCAYDPYYSGGSYGGGTYSSGYGDGYGYGNSNFSTSFFVSTGNPRWAYDPYARCYYDNTRRAYYDPYLYGYYPVGYRPRQVYGSPHPHGWTNGRYIAPPSRIRSYNLTNYNNRSERYRGLGRNWSRNVRAVPPGNNNYRRDQYSNPRSYSSGRRDDYSSNRGSYQRGSSGRYDSREMRGNRPPPPSRRGNISVATPQQRQLNSDQGRSNRSAANFPQRKSLPQGINRSRESTASRINRQPTRNTRVAPQPTRNTRVAPQPTRKPRVAPQPTRKPRVAPQPARNTRVAPQPRRPAPQARERQQRGNQQKARPSPGKRDDQRKNRNIRGLGQG